MGTFYITLLKIKITKSKDFVKIAVKKVPLISGGTLNIHYSADVSAFFTSILPYLEPATSLLGALSAGTFGL